MRYTPAAATAMALMLGVSCGLLGGPKPPPQEDVLPLLQQEAQALKRDGENINPKLEVDMTWEIGAIQLHPQPDNEAQPWKGTVEVKIISKIPELDGYITEETPKTFTYAWDVETQKWVMQ